RVCRPLLRRTGSAQSCDDAPRVALRAPAPAAAAGGPPPRGRRFFSPRPPLLRRTGSAQSCDDAPRVALRAPAPAAAAGPPDRRRHRFLAARRHRRPPGAADPAQLKAPGRVTAPAWGAGNNFEVPVKTAQKALESG